MLVAGVDVDMPAQQPLHDIQILRDLGVEHIVNSVQSSFRGDLIAALEATGATLAFDAIGGGKLASQVLSGMEAVASASAKTYSGYGSSVYKQVYIYGSLDTGPTELTRGFGMSWGIGGWLLSNFLAKVGPEAVARLKGAGRSRDQDDLRQPLYPHYLPA
jgi:NADPH:quinone reductase